jgi:hypothetical protein
VARGRHEDPDQHLHRRRLAGAVRPQVAEQLALLDAKGDVTHGLDGAPAAPEAAVAQDELFAKPLDLDHPPPPR